MFTKKFLIDTAERVIMTMAEAAVGILGVDLAVNAFHIDWHYVAGMSLGAGVVTFLKALYARKVGDKENASLVQ